MRDKSYYHYFKDEVVNSYIVFHCRDIKIYSTILLFLSIINSPARNILVHLCTLMKIFL